jgi:hypothetical protein
MKKYNKKYKQQKAVKELAEQFTVELDKQLPVTVLPDGSVVYKDYLVKQLLNGNWGIYQVTSTTFVEQYFLKSCALMAAKAYHKTDMFKFFEIKQLDNRYWANYCDNLVYKKNIKTAKEFERYLILLNKLEDSEQKTLHYKEEISRMFKWSFV